MSALIIFNALLTKLAFGFQYSDKVAVAEIYKDGTANPGDWLSKAKSNVSINITQIHSGKRAGKQFDCCCQHGNHTNTHTLAGITEDKYLTEEEINRNCVENV